MADSISYDDKSYTVCLKEHRSHIICTCENGIEFKIEQKLESGIKN